MQAFAYFPDGSASNLQHDIQFGVAQLFLHQYFLMKDEHSDICVVVDAA